MTLSINEVEPYTGLKWKQSHFTPQVYLLAPYEPPTIISLYLSDRRHYVLEYSLLWELYIGDGRVNWKRAVRIKTSRLLLTQQIWSENLISDLRRCIQSTMASALCNLRLSLMTVIIRARQRRLENLPPSNASWIQMMLDCALLDQPLPFVAESFDAEKRTSWNRKEKKRKKKPKRSVGCESSVTYQACNRK